MKPDTAELKTALEEYPDARMIAFHRVTLQALLDELDRTCEWVKRGYFLWPKCELDSTGELTGGVRTGDKPPFCRFCGGKVRVEQGNE